MILVYSESMDSNKKPDRNEQALIRCSGPVRKALAFTGPIINVQGGEDSVDLKVHQAFSKDLKALKDSGIVPSDQLHRVGFVTSEVFKRLSDNKNFDALPVIFGAP